MSENRSEKLFQILKKQERAQAEIEKIRIAFEFAQRQHDGQYRVSEEPYIVHPLEVACILADLECDTPTICAALLHDVLEDTETTEETLKEIFGEDILKLVKGVTKLDKIQFKSKEERQAENFRKMFIAMAQDIRVILLKLADRLHNMRTLNYMLPEKQKRIAQETLEIFAPLANRLGIGKIKAELEDLSLRYINPEKYYEIAQLVAQKKTERDMIVQDLIEKINESLQTSGIQAKIKGRAKHYYSIYNKMQQSQKAYHDLYDITGVRVIVDSEKECYEVLGIIHSLFKPIPGRFKDYIAMPKSNLYRSLHTSVIGPRGKPVEVQIRTSEMNNEAEFGIAAHWKYKEVGSQQANSDMDQKFAWLRKVLEFEQDVTNAKEFVDTVKVDLFSDQVFVFTPMGDVFDLPSGATPIDFAYRVHTEIGHKTTGALVNGRIVTFDTVLENGDIVEILTSKTPNPRLDWLNIVTTSHAKSKIKHWFRKNKKEEHVALGKASLENELTKAKFDEYLRNGALLDIAKQMNYQTEEDMFASLGYGETTINKILNKIKKSQPEEENVEIKVGPSFRAKKQGKSIIGLEGLLYHIAKCCTPLPGEPIVGVVTRSRGVTVHRADCDSLDSVPKERLMNIRWAETVSDKKYVVNLKIEAMDKVGVLQTIIAKVADSKTNIVEASVSAKNKKFGTINLGIEITDIENLSRVTSSLLSIPDVISVKRQQTSTVNVSKAPTSVKVAGSKGSRKK
jgi:RelA/SpoT family (p)ppGpp synthetase